jgi:hypothetical protein
VLNAADTEQYDPSAARDHGDRDVSSCPKKSTKTKQNHEAEPVGKPMGWITIPPP